MSIRNSSQKGGPVFSLIQSESTQQWQCTYLPEAPKALQWRRIHENSGTLQKAISVRQFSDTLVQEYNWIRDLGDAENGLINFRPELAYGQVLVRDVVSYYRFSNIGLSKHFILKCTSEPIFLETDVILFRRVIGEVLKNALEASLDHQSVTVGCWSAGSDVEITIHNERMIPEPVQGNVFRHSSSTKGPGRGFGTYCVKLFGEKYLGGSVSFRSSESQGTTFFLSFPRIQPGEDPERMESKLDENVLIATG